jgi:hypothetical protein
MWRGMKDHVHKSRGMETLIAETVQTTLPLLHPKILLHPPSPVFVFFIVEGREKKTKK